MIKESETVRVNCRIGSIENLWLDAESKRTGVSKSALIQMAVEAYIIDSYEKQAIMQGIAKKMQEKR